MIRAPAAMYARWIARTRSGWERFSSGSARSSETPPEWSIVPIAPSHTSTWVPRRASTAAGPSGAWTGGVLLVLAERVGLIGPRPFVGQAVHRPVDAPAMPF